MFQTFLLTTILKFPQKVNEAIYTKLTVDRGHKVQRMSSAILWNQYITHDQIFNDRSQVNIQLNYQGIKCIAFC
jgi:hypothetical protein